MSPHTDILPGIACLPPTWLEGCRTGLVAHPASLLEDGTHSAEHLRSSGVDLCALFGPEHGFWGRGEAGEKMTDAHHPEWQIPIHSLYGETREPTPAMLAQLDAVVFDIQSIACRAYTYGSTLRLVMEACAKHGKRLVVADRPDPLMQTAPDGPMLDPSCSSFVGLLPTPFCYGLTPGETSLFLKHVLGLQSLDLRVSPCQGLSRNRPLAAAFGNWPPPSPAIVSLQSALCFPITVFLEALPMIDHARGTPLAFQRIGSLHADLSSMVLPPLDGVDVRPCEYLDKSGNVLRGLSLEVTAPAAYRPALAAYALIHALEKHVGMLLWEYPGTRRNFYAKLWGTQHPAPPWTVFQVPERLYR